MKITGGCHCEKVRYCAEIDPNKIMLCHCTDCQRMSGSAFRGVVVTSDASLELVGDVKDYVKTTARSGTPRVQAFCPECGTHLYSTAAQDMPKGTKPYMIRLGTVDQQDQLTPNMEIWCSSRKHWLNAVDGAIQIEEQSA